MLGKLWEALRTIPEGAAEVARELKGLAASIREVNANFREAAGLNGPDRQLPDRQLPDSAPPRLEEKAAVKNGRK
jgi:hypothetical protein